MQCSKLQQVFGETDSSLEKMLGGVQKRLEAHYAAKGREVQEGQPLDELEEEGRDAAANRYGGAGVREYRARQ